MAYTTSKPTGLSIKRDTETFIFNWKKGDNNYDGGQNFSYSKGGEWIDVKIGKKETEKAIEILATDYYPHTDAVLNSVGMRVQGKRSKFKKNGRTVKPKVSEWAEYYWTMNHPQLPEIKETLDSELWNKCVFEWTVATSDSDNYWFVDTEWQTMLVKDSNVEDGGKLVWDETQYGWDSGFGTNEGSQVYEEDTFDIIDGSFTRWFRVRSRGAGGASEWSYSRHVYALTYQANVESVVATVQPTGGFQCRVIWDAPSTPAHPIDKTTVEYTITVPEENLTCPDEASWVVANTSADTSEKDAIVFPIDRLLSVNQCLFVRVNTEHDRSVTYGLPVLAEGGIGVLSDPVLTNVVLGDNYRVTVTATNSSEVPDSYLVILYRPASDPTSEIVIGTIAHGETTANVQAPDWSGETAFAFGVYAAIGDPITISHDGAVMKSSIVWGTGDVPKAPENVRVSATNITGTVRVEWDWTWTEADGAEISWSDHEDAWESTDQPEVFELSNIRNSRWNISGLETGIKWYIRVRLKKGSGDNETFGAYSEIAVIDLTSAPSVPTLVLSESVITEDGNVTASWVYTTTDGTAQIYAEVCEAEITSSGVVYGRVIAHTETTQHVTISAEDVGWETGQTYNLCVRVISASGRVSDDWSAPVPIAIAEPLEVNITETSLVEENIETNPRTFSGNPISFETEMEEKFAELKVALEPMQDDVPWIGTETDTTPYIMRSMSTQSNDYNRESDKIIGGTVAWNQLAEIVGYPSPLNGVTFTVNSDGSVTVNGTASGNARWSGFFAPAILGHVYYTQGCPSGGSNSTYRLYSSYIGDTLDYGSGRVVKHTGSTSYPDARAEIFISSGYTANNLVFKPQYFDLTAMFGSTIADYIYSLEQATAGAGVAWFRRLFPNDYYEYNAGELMSVEGVSSHDTVGFNQWDEEWELGSFNDNTGQETTASDVIRCKNYIRALPNTTYYAQIAGKAANIYFYDINKNYISFTGRSGNGTFTTPNNCAYIRFRMNAGYGTTYNNDICINISNASRNGEYEPYEKHSYPLDNLLTLRGIPKLDASNNLYYDGDTYESDGTVTRKYGIVDLGTLTPIVSTLVTNGATIPISDAKIWAGGSYIPNGIVVGYTAVKSNENNFTGGKEWTIRLSTDAGGILIADPSWAGKTASEIKASLNGVYYAYELATPTTETATAYTNPQVVDSDGTEEYVTTGIVPVGHESTYSLVCPISGWNEISASVTGKNLFDSKPYSGVGYNLASGTDVELTESAIAITQSENGFSYEITSAWQMVNFKTAPLKAGTYHIQVGGADSTSRTSVYVVGVDGKTKGSAYNATGTTIISTNKTLLDGEYILVASGRTTAGTQTLITPQIELGSTATAYEPYQGNTYTTELPQTVYGGTLDLVSGELVVDRAMVLIKNLTWIQNTTSYPATPYFYTTISDGIGGQAKQPLLLSSAYRTGTNLYERADGIITNANYHVANTLEINVFDSQHASVSLANFLEEMGDEQIVYPLATPQTYQLTPQQIATLVGVNKVWSDFDMEVRIAESVRNVLSLKEMPLTLTVDKTNITAVIERANSYHIDRPDETVFDGYKGETVALKRGNVTSIGLGDLIGSLDDGAAYKIIATVKDDLGQSASTEIPFEVHWTHQALMPDGTVQIDGENLVAMILPTAPAEADETDTVDIYRLSSDRPQLIVKDGTFGETYVDPYVPIGQFGGYRLVYRTANDDYITEDNELAWVDLIDETLEIDYTVIDFDGGQIMLHYNVDVSSTWEKDFQETKYLGGSVQGDWNPAVSRTSSVSAVAITISDEEEIEMIRRLAASPTLCHVRTKDGSSYSADVQVAETYSHDKLGRIAAYTFTITRVDPEGLDGMTLAQWDSINEEEEDELEQGV